jgi:hypothetical protein
MESVRRVRETYPNIPTSGWEDKKMIIDPVKRVAWVALPLPYGEDIATISIPLINHLSILFIRP